MTDAQIASQLADKLVRTAAENGPEADAARAELAGVSQEVSNLVAKEISTQLRRDYAVCGVFSNHHVPLWFDTSRDILVATLEELAQKQPLYGSFLVILRTMQVRRADREGAGTARRLASTLARPWVIAFVWIPVPFAIIAAATVESAALRLGLVISIVAVLLFAVVLEARLRRCPTCRRWLAATLVGLRHAGSYQESVQVQTVSGGVAQVDRTRDSYASLWRCVHCKHRWER
jgi:hypothetical protein